jgi:uncharacterized LabA/DUF88 family protein
MRVAAFIDGFNLYHAIDNTGLSHLKWLNLWSLCEAFAPSPQFTLTAVYYFSAFATWRSYSCERHRQYVEALKAVRVTPILGRFKEKNRSCRSCETSWKDHEEKESDVNIALHLYREAARDRYDRALLVTQDSDLVPAVRMVRGDFPKKTIRILTPIGLHHSYELATAAGDLSHARAMKRVHIEHALFPREVVNQTGTIAAIRPREYDPPAAP